MAKITDQFIRALQVPEGEPEAQEIDDDLPGFGVRKQKIGHVSLFVKYSIGKQQRRRTFTWVPGTLPAIRKEAAVVLAQAKLGKDVGEASKAQQVAIRAAKATLGQLIGPYLLLREKGNEFWKPLRPKSLVEVTRYLEKSWQPLHGEPVDKITRQQVRARRDEIVKESGAVSANRALVALSGFCGWAIGEEHIPGTNPTSDIKVLHENKRERVLSEEELVWIWLCAGDDEFGRIIKLLMLTGQRCREIGELEWAEVRLRVRVKWGEISMIDLPDSRHLPKGRTKNKRRHLIPLSKPALALVGEMPQDPPKYVFGRFVGRARCKAALDKRIAERRGKPLEPWRLHDLRHTFVTTVNELGFAEPYITEAVVNHLSGAKAGIAGRYDHAKYLKQRCESLDKWGTWSDASFKAERRGAWSP